jgi:hypothetical protein
LFATPPVKLPGIKDVLPQHVGSWTQGGTGFKNVCAIQIARIVFFCPKDCPPASFFYTFADLFSCIELKNTQMSERPAMINSLVSSDLPGPAENRRFSGNNNQAMFRDKRIGREFG